MPTIVREIAVIGSSIVAAERCRMRGKARPAFVVRDYTPVTPDRPVVGRSVSNGDHMALTVRLRVLVHLERRADCVELWRERQGSLVDAIRRGGRWVETGLFVKVERRGLQIGLEVFAVRTSATVDLVGIYRYIPKNQSITHRLNHRETVH